MFGQLFMFAGGHKQGYIITLESTNNLFSKKCLVFLRIMFCVLPVRWCVDLTKYFLLLILGTQAFTKNKLPLVLIYGFWQKVNRQVLFCFPPILADKFLLQGIQNTINSLWMTNTAAICKKDFPSKCPKTTILITPPKKASIFVGAAMHTCYIAIGLIIMSTNKPHTI